MSKGCIVVTGASGFIGTLLVPRLEAAGWTVLLVGRERAKLAAKFPGRSVCAYEDLAKAAKGADAMLHLATQNNDVLGDAESFIAANVTLLEQCLDAMRRAGVSRIIYPASLQANPAAKSEYGQSKYVAETHLGGLSDISVAILRLPAVYSDTEFRGKLGVLSKLPPLLRPIALDVLSSLKPTVHIDRVTEAVLDALERPANETRYITNQQIGNKAYALGKWLLDMAFALSVALLFWWLLLGIWIAVRVTSDGSGLFAQTRLGRKAAPFTCLKFRTMAMDTAQVGTHEAPASAVTSIGGILRKLKLDELPQIWNIMRGELSLVGPRPGLPGQLELRAARLERGVFDVRAGITGLGQIRGVDMSTPERLADIDAEYIALRCLPLDFKIVLATFLGRGMGDRIRKA